jgi:hypothetical protein
MKAKNATAISHFETHVRSLRYRAMEARPDCEWPSQNFGDMDLDDLIDAWWRYNSAIDNRPPNWVRVKTPSLHVSPPSGSGGGEAPGEAAQSGA